MKMPTQNSLLEQKLSTYHKKTKDVNTSPSFFDHVNFNYLFISNHTSAWKIIKIPY